MVRTYDKPYPKHPSGKTRNLFTVEKNEKLSMMPASSLSGVSSLAKEGGLYAPNSLPRFAAYVRFALHDEWRKHLQKILGHSALEMTQRYAHMSPAHLEKAIQIVSFKPDGMENVLSLEDRKNKNSVVNA